MTISIDLGFKVVPDSTSIWTVFPGTRRRHFEDFVKTKRLFLELPDFIVPTNFSLTNSNVATGMRKSVRRAFAWDTYYRDQARGSTSTKPPIDLSKYSGAIDPTDGKTNTMLGCVGSLFHRAQKGDLVIVPSKGSYGQVLFGEIETDYSAEDTIRVSPYGDSSVSTRKVKWIKTVHERRDLPRDLTKHLERPPAVHEIIRTELTEQAFGFAYGSFVSKFGNETLIDAPGYSGKNPAELLSIFNLTFLLAALYQAKENGESVQGLQIYDIIAKYKDTDQFYNFQSSFSSPGFIKAKSKTLGLSVFMIGAIALAGKGILSEISSSSEIFPSNSKGEMPEDINKDFLESLDFLDLNLDRNQISQVEQMAKASNQDLKAVTSAKVTKDNATTQK